MLLHLRSHPFVFVVEHGLNLRPVCICDSDWNLQLGWGILQNIVNIGVDGVKLTVDNADGIVQDSLNRIILTDSRLQLKGGINPSGSRFSRFSLNCFKSEIRFTSPSSACWASTSCSMSFTISSKPVFPSLFLLFLKHSYCCLSVETTMSWLWLAYGVCHLDTAVCNLPAIFVILLVTARFKRWATTATRFRHCSCCFSVVSKQ